MRSLLLCLLLLLASIASAAKFTTDAFNAQINIKADGTVSVLESISVTFLEPQHGLIRKLPITTSGGDNLRTVEYSLLAVRQDQGSGMGDASVREGEDDGDWVVRVGSANQTVSGKVTYEIAYNVRGAITPFREDPDLGQHSEFLWNLSPANWPTSIESASFVITYPRLEVGEFRARVLVGARGTRRGIELDRQNHVLGNTELVDARISNNELTIQPRRSLEIGESVTVVLALPGNTVVAPTTNIRRNTPYEEEPNIRFPKAPPGFGFVGLAPLLAVVIAYFGTKIHWAPPKKPLVVRFDPPDNVNASLAGLVMDGNVDQRDIVAGIVSLAQKGGLRLHHAEEGGPGVVLELLGLDRLRKPDQFELSLYKALEPYGQFVTPDMLRGSFGQSYQALVAMLYGEASYRGIWRDVSGLKTGAGCLLFSGVGLLAVVGLFFNPCLAIVSAVVALPIGTIMSSRMSPLTLTGHEVKWHLEGLHEFISRAHQKELNYMVDRMPDQALFESLLPYAVAFGLVKQWSQAFQGIDLQMPDWYVGDYTGMDMIWTSMIVNDLLDLDRSYGETMAYSPPTTSFESGDFFSSGDTGFGGSWDSGGDGGFSGGSDAGGGGGGGGGDSW